MGRTLLPPRLAPLLWGLTLTTAFVANFAPLLFFIAFLCAYDGGLAPLKAHKKLILALIGFALWPCFAPLLTGGSLVFDSSSLRLVIVVIGTALVSRCDLRRVALGISIALALATVCVLALNLFSFGLKPHLNWSPFFSRGTIYGLLAALSASWALWGSGKLWPLYLCALGGGILLTYASVAYVAFIAQGLVFLLWCLVQKKAFFKTQGRRILAALVLLFGLSLMVVAHEPIRARFGRELTQLTSTNMNTFTTQRSHIWSITAKNLRSHPFKALGWDRSAFSASWNDWLTQEKDPPLTRVFDSPHNSLLQAALIGGVPFALAYLALILASGWALVRSFFSSAGSKPEVLVLCASFAALLLAGLGESLVSAPYATFEMSWFPLLAPLFWRHHDA